MMYTKCNIWHEIAVDLTKLSAKSAHKGQVLYIQHVVRGPSCLLSHILRLLDDEKLMNNPHLQSLLT